jgi:hypothetical protein
MTPLYRQAIVQSVFGTALFIALIFWPAGTFHYWQGWLFFAVFATATTGFTIYLAIYDKPLLERRLKAGPQHEQAWSQKIIVSLAFVAFFAIIALPALDHRFGWSRGGGGFGGLGGGDFGGFGGSMGQAIQFTRSPRRRARAASAALRCRALWPS